VNPLPHARSGGRGASAVNAESEPDPGIFSLPETRIAVIYVLLASLWIIGSDSLLHRLVGDASQNAAFQTIKGLNFVLTTGLLLYIALRRAYGGWRKSEERRMAALKSARERLRALSARIQDLREEERARISREIHDELGQLLTGVKMQLRLIENNLTDREDRALNPVIDDLVEASDLIDETIRSVQRISADLRPRLLDDLGLAAALGEEAGQFTRRTGIECRLTLGEMNDSIPADVETAAFRIFQESLTNVARHAEAVHIDAECSTADNVLKLTVQDDGVGINPDVIERPASLGLFGMFERATCAGGHVDINPASGRGTRVVLTIPLRSHTNPDRR
jgi:signal transduction histidine kinase